MVLIITPEDHAGVLSYADGINITREAFLEYCNHPEFNETRHRVRDPDSDVRVSVHQAVCPRLGGAGLMTHTERGSDAAVRVHVLHDCETGELLAVFLGELAAKEIPPSGRITPDSPRTGSGSIAFRTACTSAVGLDAVSQSGVSSLGIFGSGIQARNHLVAFDRVRDFESARVYSPTKAHREAFAEELPTLVDIEVIPVDDPESVIRGADVILAATNTNSPVFDGALLEPGQTVISIVGTKREIDDKTMDRASLVVTNSIEQAGEFDQPDLTGPIDRGVIDWDDVILLRDIIGDRHPGRNSQEDIVVYKNNVGEGIVDVALAAETYERVVAKDGGLVVDVDPI